MRFQFPLPWKVVMRTGCRLLATFAGGAVLAAGGAPAADAAAAPAAGDPWLVYVANRASNSVSVIDTATHAVVATVPVGAAPTSVTISSDGTAANVVNEGDHTVSVIDTFTNAVAETTKPGADAGPQGTATTPDGATSYVVDTARDLVSVIDTATKAVVATISGVGDGPCAVAITPDGATAYVANVNSGTVSLIDTASNSVLDIVAVGRRPSGVAITPDQAPTAALAVAPAPAGQPTTLDASDSTVRFGAIATYAWNFGDGTKATTTVPTTTHAYSTAGPYTVTLTLTSSGGTATTHVFSGQILIRNGRPQARTVHTVAIPASVDGEAGGLPITGTAAGPVAVLGLLVAAVGSILLWITRKPAAPVVSGTTRGGRSPQRGPRHARCDRVRQE
jgi:YVTN family beta-propeller protein